MPLWYRYWYVAEFYVTLKILYMYYLLLGSGTSFSRVLPTSLEGYHARKPIESVVYCFYKITLSKLWIYRHNKPWVFNQSERAYYLTYFIMKNNFGKILTELLVLITLDGTKLYSSGRSQLEFLLEFDIHFFWNERQISQKLWEHTQISENFKWKMQFCEI